jgi:FkbM family methyltransferase
MVRQEIFGAEVYRDVVAPLWEGDIVLDVGAHTGLSTLYFAEKVSGLRIVAFEPAPTTYECLVRNLSAYVPGATAHPYAIGAVSGDASFTYYPETPSQSGQYASREADDQLTQDYLVKIGHDPEDAESLLADLHVGQVMSVPMYTISEVITRYRLEHIALIKIDVERAELDVLDGISEADWPRISSIVAEVHDLDGRLEVVRRMLTRHSFDVAVRQESWLAGTELWTIHAMRLPLQ